MLEERSCPRCDGETTEGFAAVTIDGTTTPLFWVEGELKREYLTRGARIQGRTRVPVYALRCDACGHIEFLGR